MKQNKRVMLLKVQHYQTKIGCIINSLYYDCDWKVNVPTWKNSVFFLFPRVTLNMADEKYSDPTWNLTAAVPKSVEFDSDSNQTVFYSKNYGICLWDTSQGRESSIQLIKNDDGIITNFHGFSSKKFLVSYKYLLKVNQLTDFNMNNKTKCNTLVCNNPGCC